jgi:hypothetical protein
MPLTFDILLAAQAASDVGAFGLVRDIFDRNDVRLCVLCLDQRAEDVCTFKDEELPVCPDCAGLNGDHRMRISKAGTMTFPGQRGYVPAGRLWVTDYRGHKHYAVGVVHAYDLNGNYIGDEQ